MNSIKNSVSQKLLIVDDEPDLANLFSEALENSGYKTHYFTNPIQALERFASNPHDYAIVICDMLMPEMSGIDLIRKMKEINRNVKVIILTAFVISKNDRESVQIDEYLQKPIHMMELIRTVEKHIQPIITEK